MNGWWTGDEIRYAAELTSPKVLIADQRRADRIDRDLGVPVVIMEDDAFAALETHEPGTALSSVPIDEDDPAAILFTSGTTGRPKGAITTHRNFLAYVSCAYLLGARGAVRFPPDDPPAPRGTSLSYSPLFHISGLHAGAIMAVAAGTNALWLTGRFDPEKVLRLTEEHRVSGWGGMTTHVWRIIEHPRFHEYDTSSVRSIGGGGSCGRPSCSGRVVRPSPMRSDRWASATD